MNDLGSKAEGNLKIQIVAHKRVMAARLVGLMMKLLLFGPKPDEKNAVYGIS